MCKPIFFLIAFFLTANLSYAEIGLSDLQRIDKLVSDKQYQKALEAYQYFFEESKKSSAMSGVRVSFALSSWAHLGSVYPPALEALKHMSDEDKALILSGKGFFNVFQEYQAINSYIGRNHATVETFLTLEKNSPEQAAEFFLVAKELLIAERKFDVVKRYYGDAIYEYESIRNSREYALSQLRKKSPGYSIDTINAEFDTKVKSLIEVATKIGMQAEAEEIRRRSSSYISGNLLRKYH